MAAVVLHSRLSKPSPMIVFSIEEFFIAKFRFVFAFLSGIIALLDLSKSCVCYTTELLVLVVSHEGRREEAQQGGKFVLYLFLALRQAETFWYSAL